MQAAYLQDGKIQVGEMADPVPGEGQALVRTHRCGLCASDVHFLHSGQNIIDLSRRVGGAYAELDLTRPIVLGHEYVGEVIDYGRGSRRSVKPGRRVTSIPLMRQGGARSVIGFSHECPGGFGELMLLDEDFLMEVPNELSDDHAALIEPLGVGFEHARRGRPTNKDTVLVLGCGAIGLSVIAGLTLMDIAPIIAADFDAERRDLAIRMGADIALDPRRVSPYAPLADLRGHQVNLIYECVGRPGMLQQILESAPVEGRIVIGGACMEADEIFAFVGQSKRLNIQFAGSEEQQDMDLAMRSIADGRIDIEHWLGSTIGLNGVAGALEAMAHPSLPVRTLLDPRHL